jgi:hypothetical protein
MPAFSGRCRFSLKSVLYSTNLTGFGDMGDGPRRDSTANAISAQVAAGANVIHGTHRSIHGTRQDP